jgi:TetR/AcrR family transcriptional regulator
MSVRELNNRLGVSHNLINRRFGSKRDLWQVTVDRWFGEIADRLIGLLEEIGPDDDLVERFDAFIVLLIELNARRPEMLRMMQFEASIEGPRLDYMYERFVAPVAATLGVAFAPLFETGQLRTLPPVTLFFLLAHGATAPAGHAALARKLGAGDPTAPEAVATHAHAVADLIIGGLRTDRAG